jgi:hypothetical protein
VDDLFRSNATERDLGRRRMLALTTVVGVSGLAAVGGLMVGLVPAGAGQVTVPTPDRTSAGPAGQERAQQRSQQPPVATSGSS